MRHLKWAPATALFAVAVCALAVHSAEPLKAPQGAVPAPVIRASQIAGMNVKNPAGQDLGKVEDVVVDMGTGKVRYAAVSFGGFLGVGDKLFAIPFHALVLKHNAGDKSTHFELNVDKQTLEKAQGFDKKNWPDFGNARFGDDYDRHFVIPTSRL